MIIRVYGQNQLTISVQIIMLGAQVLSGLLGRDAFKAPARAHSAGTLHAPRVFGFSVCVQGHIKHAQSYHMVEP